MSSEDIERRRRLESAVEDDDWSSVIDGQTKLTEDPKLEEEAPTATVIRLVFCPTVACCARVLSPDISTRPVQRVSPRTSELVRRTGAFFRPVFDVDCIVCTPHDGTLNTWRLIGRGIT